MAIGGAAAMRTAIDLGQYVVLSAFAASLTFVLVCSLAWKWWRTVWGRTSVAISAALSVALLPGVLHLLVGVDTAAEWFRWYYDTSIAAVAAIEVWRTVAVVRAQWRKEPPA
jgi:hypothetical protein